MKKFFSIAAVLVLALATASSAQESIRDVVDAGDVATAKKMVKNGEIDEIYCGKLTANDAVAVYEKIFKQMPDESFVACPSQFAYGYGVKVCSNAKAMNACTEVVTLLLNESTTGNLNAIETLDKVTKAVLKTKAFAKPVKEPVDTTLWVACTKKNKKNPACESDSGYTVDTTISVSRPSPLMEKLRTGISEGYWKSPMSVAERFAKLMQANAKALAIADTSIPNLKYVQRWAEFHKADSTALPGGQLFRFCTAWQPKVDSILTALEFETRCPVFETFVDSRDNKSYKVKEINGVNWFVENLDFVMEDGSMCYDRDDENCKAYGRLYTQQAAMTACPEGSRLATDEDWKVLEDFAGGASNAGSKLRSNGSDDFAFTALFGGYANKNNISTVIGEGAYFWTEKSSDDGRGVARSMFSSDNDISTISVDKAFFLSVRCIKDAVAAPAASAESAETTEAPAEAQ